MKLKELPNSLIWRQSSKKFLDIFGKWSVWIWCFLWFSSVPAPEGRNSNQNLTYYHFFPRPLEFKNYPAIRRDRGLIWICTLSIVLFLFKTRGFGDLFCLNLQVKPIQLGPIDRASAYLDLSTITFLHSSSISSYHLTLCSQGVEVITKQTTIELREINK
jgi:hypothetical protein